MTETEWKEEHAPWRRRNGSFTRWQWTTKTPIGTSFVTFSLREGFSVEEATNGREALERIRSRHYDVIILDILMPYVDGYEVMRHLKARTPEILRCVVVVSRMNLKDMKTFFPGCEVIQKPANNEATWRWMGHRPASVRGTQLAFWEGGEPRPPSTAKTHSQGIGMTQYAARAAWPFPCF